MHHQRRRIAFLAAAAAIGLALLGLLFVTLDERETSRDLGGPSAGWAEGPTSSEARPREPGFAAQRRDDSAGVGAEPLAGDLHVLCLAPDGTPVPGLEVEVRTLDRSGERPLETFFSQRADASGRLCFAGAREVLLREEAPHGWALATSEFRPWVAPLRLDLARDFERVVEWRLPPFGAVEVRVLDPCGRLYAEPISFELEEAEGAATRPLSADSADGIARFENVGLALPFLLRTRWGRLGVIPDRRVEALSSHGECRLVEVRLGGSSTALCMCLFDADGTCLGDAELWASFPREASAVEERSGPYTPRSSFVARLFTDRKGRAFLEADAASLKLLLRDPKRAQCLLVELPLLREGEDRDLGELHLRRAEILASGRVLGNDGALRPDAIVDAYPLPLVGRLYENPTGADARFSVRCDEEGRFAMHALDPSKPLPSRLLLCARDARAELCAEPLEIECGAMEIELRLSATGRLLVELLLPEEPRRGWFSTRLVDAAGRAWSLSSRARNKASALVAEGLPPGIYTLGIHLDLEDAPLVSVTNIVVPSGGECADARLRPLDLRPHVHVIALDLERADGAPLAFPGILELREPSAGIGATRSLAVRIKDFRAVLPARPFVGTLRFDGCEPAELDLGSPRQRVVLRPR
ncbi:MAG: hypothetical protein JNM84_08180 [Planctomycetes bacterium]|nr:hypothetical protein [Planctomycetota bacterium]